MPKKRNKAYRPKYVPGALPPIFRFDAETEQQIQAIPLSALHKLAEGYGDQRAWSDIVFRLNVGQQIARDHFQEPELRQLCLDALLMMQTVWHRYQATKELQISSEEKLIVVEALGYIDDMQLKITRKEMLAINDKVYAASAVTAKMNRHLVVGEMVPEKQKVAHNCN